MFHPGPGKAKSPEIFVVYDIHIIVMEKRFLEHGYDVLIKITVSLSYVIEKLTNV